MQSRSMKIRGRASSPISDHGSLFGRHLSFRLVALAGAVAMMLVAAPRAAQATASFELLLDCGSAAGVQTSCTYPSGTTSVDVSVVLKNNSGAASNVAGFDFHVIANQAVFTPKASVPAACAASTLDCNPDANNTVLVAPGWGCTAAPDENLSASIADSHLDCANLLSNSQAIPNGGSLTLATVHYTSVNGVGSFTLANAMAVNSDVVELMSCIGDCPAGAAVVTVGAGSLLPPVGTTVTGSFLENGITAIHWVGDFTLTAAPVPPCTGATATYTMIVTAASGATPLVGAVIRSGPMTETPLNSGTYAALVPQFYPLHSFRVGVTITFSGGTGAGCGPINFPIYIDPSGWVKNTLGTPIVGATVTLFRSDFLVGPFAQVANGDTGVMSPANSVNPDLTDGGGHFGWDVVAGYYKVQATKLGCWRPGFPANPMVETAVMTIPPPVTDVLLTLQCPTTAVGGVAEPADLSALSAQASSQPGGHAARFTVAGASLVAAAALGAGWHARRRRVS